MRELWLKLADNDIRIDQCIILAGNLGGDCTPMSDQLEEYLTIISADEMAETFGGIPDYLVEALESDDNVLDAFENYCIQQERFGFLVMASTPVNDSWGYYSSVYVYGETVEEAMKKIFDWATDIKKASAK